MVPDGVRQQQAEATEHAVVSRAGQEGQEHLGAGGRRQNPLRLQVERSNLRVRLGCLEQPEARGQAARLERLSLVLPVSEDNVAERPARRLRHLERIGHVLARLGPAVPVAAPMPLAERPVAVVVVAPSARGGRGGRPGRPVDCGGGAAQGRAVPVGGGGRALAQPRIAVLQCEHDGEEATVGAYVLLVDWRVEHDVRDGLERSVEHAQGHIFRLKWERGR
eukprot:scaffold3221_cov118-Isochrysis_galbana.AAC.6